ncbi:MAG TPA: DUF3313 family protein [Gammaproteobacteria bacterium]|jgi:hypothetical protein|nr:DUF3313 family protein [Gammaproteobacteria bacterium]
MPKQSAAATFRPLPLGALAIAVFGPLLGSCTSTTVVEPYYRPPDAVLEDVYLAPGADFGAYSRLMFESLDIHYPDGSVADPADLDRLRAYFRDAFREAVQQDYEITQEPAADVLLVKAQLVDLKIVGAEGRYKPTGRLATLVAAGQLTLLMDMADSLTGKVLARAGASTEPSQSSSADPEAAWRDVQVAAQSWAALFRNWLDRNTARSRTQGAPRSADATGVVQQNHGS